MKKTICIAGLTFLFCGFSGAQVFRMTTNVVVQAQPLWEVGHELSRLYGIRVCTEVSTDEPLFTFDLQNAKLERVLQEITNTCTNYVWEYDKSADCLNIYPAENSKTSRVFQSLDFGNVNLIDFLKKDGHLKLDEQSLYFDPARGNLTWLKTPMTVQGEGLSTRQVLNRLCLQLPFKAHWQIRKTEAGARGKLILTFRRFW